MQEETPSKIAGQVFKTHTAISFAPGLFGLLIAGFVTELTLVNLGLIINSSLLIIATAFCWRFLPLD